MILPLKSTKPRPKQINWWIEWNYLAPINNLITKLSSLSICFTFILSNNINKLRMSEYQKWINKSSASLNHLCQYYMLLLARKASKALINTTFKVYALQYINYIKLVNNRYLQPRRKNRIYKGRSIFMRHLHDKVGNKPCYNGFIK